MMVDERGDFYLNPSEATKRFSLAAGFVKTRWRFLL